MNHEPLPVGFQFGLAAFYLICAGLNFGFAQFYVADRRLKNVWGAIGFVFLLHALLYIFTASFTPASAPVIPHVIVDVTNTVLNHIWGPILYFVGSVVGFAALIYWRRTLTHPTVAIAVMNVMLLISGWAMTNPDFRSIITKEDNVPIVMLIVTVGFFTWLGLRRAVLNDTLTEAAKPVMAR